MPKFGDWDVNDPASAEGFTVIFNKARNEKKTGGSSQSPQENDSTYNKRGTATFGGKSQSVSFASCLHLFKMKIFYSFVKSGSRIFISSERDVNLLFSEPIKESK